MRICLIIFISLEPKVLPIFIAYHSIILARISKEKQNIADEYLSTLSPTSNSICGAFDFSERIERTNIALIGISFLVSIIQF